MILGLDDLNRKITGLGYVDSDLMAAVRKQAEMVRGVAVGLCPVDTGELRGSIHTMTTAISGGAQGVVYTNKEYAAYVEFGTGTVGEENHSGISPNIAVSYRQTPWNYMDKDGKWHHTKGQAAQPYMYPALKSMEKKVVAGLQEDMKAAFARKVQ